MSYFENLEWDDLLTKVKAPYIPKKFRTISANNYYKNMKGNKFFVDFYKTQNAKDKDLKLNPNNPDIEIWDSDTL